MLDAYRVHPEAKSLGPDGRPCGPATKGLLGRRRLHLIDVRHIGKEANKLHERRAGLVHAERDVLSTYAEPGAEPWPSLVAPVLRELPVALAAEQSGLSARTVKSARAGRPPSRPGNRAALTLVAADHARACLRKAGMKAPRDDLAACAAYRDSLGGVAIIC